MIEVDSYLYVLTLSKLLKIEFIIIFELDKQLDEQDF